jgi:hypothetical protein
MPERMDFRLRGNDAGKVFRDNVGAGPRRSE